MQRPCFSVAVTNLCSLLLIGGVLVNQSLSQDFPRSWFSVSQERLPELRAVSWLQASADDGDESGEDVSKSVEDGPGVVVPDVDITIEDYFDQLIGSQLENLWNFSANYTGRQAGQPVGYTSLNALRTSGGGTILDTRLHITNLGDVGGSVGLGRRSITNGQLLGLHVSLDASETQTGSRFATASISAELVNETWDVRANGYWPVSDQVGSANFSSISNTAFVGNDLVGDVSILQEVSLAGFDLEASRRVGGSDLWGYGGVYHYQTPGDETWGARYGARGFLANRVFADLHVSNDSMFGSEVGFGFSWLFGGQAVESASIAERMASIPVRRQGLVATEFTTLSLPAQTLTHPDSTPLAVQHVDSTAVPGGDGSVIDPYDTLAAVVSQPDDVIHLIRDSNFAGQSITLQPGQQLLGESNLPDGNTVATQFGPATLPAGLGTNPAQISGSPGAAAITLAANTRVTNIEIISPVGDGILGNSFSGDVALDRLNIQAVGANGINLDDIDGNTTISNSTIYDSWVNGIQLVDMSRVSVIGTEINTVGLGGTGCGLSAITTGTNFMELTVIENLFDAALTPNSFQVQALGSSVIELRMLDNEADDTYDLFVAGTAEMAIAGNLGVGNLYFNSDNGNLQDNGNTTLGGPPTVIATGEFLIIPW